LEQVDKQGESDGVRVRECKMSENRALVSPAEANEVDGASKLLCLASLGEELGAQYIADDAYALAARVSEGRFYLACIGQFKRGKSTLINALTGEPILPVGFIPVTAVPTVIRFGAHPRARVQGRDGSWQVWEPEAAGVGSNATEVVIRDHVIPELGGRRTGGGQAYQ